MNPYSNEQLKELLDRNNGNIAKAAREIGMSRTGLSQTLRIRGIIPPTHGKTLLPGQVFTPPALPPAQTTEIRKEEFSKGTVASHGKERVLVIGDIHEPFTHKKYRTFVRQVHDEFGCTKTVFIGDVADNHASSYHEHNPDGLSAGHELSQTQKSLALWATDFPEALICIGNHDELVYRKAITHGLPNHIFKGFNEIYKTPATWQWKLSWTIDNVIYQHGTGSSGENAHKKRALANRQSTVIGHVHSHGGVSYMASDKDLIFGMNVGCGIDIKSYAMLYGRDFASRPTLGCGVVLEGKHAFFIPMDLGTKIRWV
jgi:hypothetical protein